MLSDEKLKFLEIMANRIREKVIEMLLNAGSGHLAGSLGMADIFTAFYFYILKHDPKNPFWEERDRVVVSNGHICPLFYATLAYAGYFPLEELSTLRKIDSLLEGHPHRGSLKGVDFTSGPLGLGLSQAIGMALAAKLDKKKYHVYCFMSDGEHNEGNVWEGIMFAAKYKLNNLTVIVDRNNIQIDGFTEDVMPLEPFYKKYEAFNWHVLEINGHNFNQIIDAVLEAKTIFEKPTVIIAHTIPGKGVSFAENDFSWHGKAPNKEEAEKALKELRTLGRRIESEFE